MAPDKYGRYEVEDEIGDGAMGRVYRGFDPLVRRKVAIKTVKSEYLTREHADSYLKRFRREVQAAGSVSHPNIVSIFDVGEDYFVMEFVEGVTLAALLKGQGSLSVSEALLILAPVAEALDHAHDAGIIHRDIKPANIMVQSDGRPKLMDFGVARLESSAMTATGQFLGSPSYMAPEQISGGEVSRKSDLFSLAVVAYEAVTGQKPFQGDSITSVIYRVMTEAPPPPRQWNFDLPARYDEVFRRALSKNPAERYATAREFVAALDLKEFDITFPTTGGAPAAAEGPAATQASGAAPTAAALAAAVIVGADETAMVTAVELRQAAAAQGQAPSPASTAVAAPAVAPTTAAAAGEKRAGARPWIPVAAVAALLIAAVAAVMVMRRPSPEPIPPGPPEPLRIETEPPGAQVLVDGKERGTSPLALPDLAAGDHQVRVSLAGYASAELGIEVVSGTSPAPLRFVLQSTMGRLTVRSVPAGAALKVDGRPAAATPAEGLSLPAGRHELKIEQKGFKPWVQEVLLQVGDNPEVAAQLEALPKPGKPAPPTPPPTPTPPPVAAEGDLVEPGPGVTDPRKVDGDSARYPDMARKLRLYGTVQVDFIVDEKGQPTELKVTESAGDVLDKAVLEAIRRWRYTPAQKDGVRVKMRMKVRQTFQKAG